MINTHSSFTGTSGGTARRECFFDLLRACGGGDANEAEAGWRRECEFDAGGRLKFGASDVLTRAVSFITENQLLRRDLWERFTGVYRDGADSANGGWRGEYFGKMMRGACFTYALTQDERLYGVLTEAIEALLKTRQADGTISSYRPGDGFRGWDMWCRKYVLLSFYYYCRFVCRDEGLRARLRDCAREQLELIMARIGPEREGKLPITRTSGFWRGLNSSSILEPVVLWYRELGDPRLLEFARYIVDNGGIEGDNIFRLAAENRLAPYQYPVNKAYEMISCMEGVLEYALVTGDGALKQAVVNFAERVLETDFTVIGSGGTTHELFDHSTWRQSDAGVCEIAQETCVTVTMLKFFTRMYAETGDARYADAVELAFYNAYLGAVNTEKQVETRLFEQSSLALVPEFLPFDSYSPLTPGRRGKKIGGFMVLPGGHYYGCCACIGSLGAAVTGLGALRVRGGCIMVDHVLPGEYCARLADGTEVRFVIDTQYPYGESARFTVTRVTPPQTGDAPENCAAAFRVRIPGWCQSVIVEPDFATARAGAGCALRRGDGEGSSGAVTEVSCRLSAGDAFTLRFRNEVLAGRSTVYGEEEVNGTVFTQDPHAAERIYLRRGAVVMAATAEPGPDGAEQPLPASAFSPEAVANARWTLNYDINAADTGTPLLRCELNASDGMAVTLSDYACTGKNWSGPEFGAWFRVDGNK